MFELSIARKYLVPRRRHLSASIIGLLSVLVISLVVWLVLVFMSVTDGMFSSWTEKLVAINSPIRLVPTPAYHQSYYARVDEISAASDFQKRTLGEKRWAEFTDPYDPTLDPAIPPDWEAPDLGPDGQLRDIVKETFTVLEGLPYAGIRAEDFESSFGNLRLRLLRSSDNLVGVPADTQTFLTHLSVLGSFDGSNPHFCQTILGPRPEDISNLLRMLAVSGENVQQDQPQGDHLLSGAIFRERLARLLVHVDIEALKPAKEGWPLPLNLLPDEGSFEACGILQGDYISQVLTSEGQLEEVYQRVRRDGYRVVQGELSFRGGEFKFTSQEGGPFRTAPRPFITVVGDLTLAAEIQNTSLERAQQAWDILFEVEGNLRGLPLKGTVPFVHLDVARSKFLAPEDLEGSSDPFAGDAPFWVYQAEDPSEGRRSFLPQDPEVGYGILLPRGSSDSDGRIGDRGYISYYTQTASSMQEQRLPIYIAGFYDAGAMMPMMGRLALVDKDITSMIGAAVGSLDEVPQNGIGLWFDDFDNAESVKALLMERLQKAGLDRYWTVETYREFPFAKHFVQQFESDKTLLSLISFIIILVACSNIISMLILLVNDKRKEIAILQSMGASSKSVAMIFGLCGFIMGGLGCVLGTALAVLTLRNMQFLVNFLSKIQGHAAFNQAFYGDSLPNTLSVDALTLVVVATAVLSILAALVPALKACSIRPAVALRAD